MLGLTCQGQGPPARDDKHPDVSAPWKSMPAVSRANHLADAVTHGGPETAGVLRIEDLVASGPHNAPDALARSAKTRPTCPSPWGE